MARARRLMTILLISVLVGLLAFVTGWLIGRTGIGSVVEPSSLAEAERAFSERMRDVALVGVFTVDGGEPKAPEPERYEIDSVEKVGDDLWQFNARMNCCGVDGAIPVVVPMRWVGDTPVILMTDTHLPQLGTFTVRLFFYRDRYSGTWQNGPVGGQMWGRIEARPEGPEPDAS